MYLQSHVTWSPDRSGEAGEWPEATTPAFQDICLLVKMWQHLSWKHGEQSQMDSEFLRKQKVSAKGAGLPLQTTSGSELTGQVTADRK